MGLMRHRQRESTIRKWIVGITERLRLDSNELKLSTPLIPNVATNDAVRPALPVVHVVNVPDGATADINVTLTHKTEILDVIVQKRAGAGGASDTITIKNAGNAITDAIDINVADKTIKRPATIDDAQSTIAAGGTLRVTRTKASGANVACLVTVVGVIRT